MLNFNNTKMYNGYVRKYSYFLGHDILHDPDNHDGVITDLEKKYWNVKSSGP